jgi:inhibitor of KinA
VTTTGVDVVRIVPAGDSALVLDLPPRIDPAVNAQAAALAAALRDSWGSILRDVVVGYCTVTVFFDPLRVDARWLESEMRGVAASVDRGGGDSGGQFEIPVCYDGDLAPDLEDVAAFGGCSPDEVVSLHLGGTYRVYLVGFVPGFAYLAEVDPRIAAPRRSTPRTAVPPGSVAIAGGQTGVYPAATPGGWNIIGRTPLKPYDLSRPEPCLLHTGDTVRFVRMSRQDFDRAS